MVLLYAPICVRKTVPIWWNKFVCMRISLYSIGFAKSRQQIVLWFKWCCHMQQTQLPHDRCSIEFKPYLNTMFHKKKKDLWKGWRLKHQTIVSTLELYLDANFDYQRRIYVSVFNHKYFKSWIPRSNERIQSRNMHHCKDRVKTERFGRLVVAVFDEHAR